MTRFAKSRKPGCMLRPLAPLAGAALAAAVLVPTAMQASAADTAPGGIKHLVVIYQENHSFDNLYGLWGSVNGEPVNGLNLTAGRNSQVGQDGATLKCLRQNDINLQASNNPAVPAPTCTDTNHILPSASATSFTSSFANGEFSINSYIAPNATTCSTNDGSSDVKIGTGAPGGCTRDIVHRFYQEKFQMDGGRQDRYVQGSDAAGLVMGYYDTTQLPIYQYLHSAGAPNYTIMDAFFQGAYGGSFANHQVLISGQLPIFPNADHSGSTAGCATGTANCDLHSVVDANGFPNSSYPYYHPLAPVKDGQLTEAAGLTGSCAPSYSSATAAAAPAGTLCGDYAINTSQPMTQPYSPGTAIGKRLPLINDSNPSGPYYETNIGDRMNAAGVSWGWYAGGWGNAAGLNGSDANHPLSKGWTGGAGPSCANANVASGATFPNCPDALFQFHHQPFGYFTNYADGSPGRTAHLKDEQDLINEYSGGAELSTYTMASSLPQVAFIKPIGEQNEHPGYTGNQSGEMHLVKLIRALLGPSNPDAASTAVLVTYDEFGGQYDHVPAPGTAGNANPSDAFGPGTRIPAILIAQPSVIGESGVDHASHDTVSVLATIEHFFGVPPVPAESGSSVATLRDTRVADLSTAIDNQQGQQGQG